MARRPWRPGASTPAIPGRATTRPARKPATPRKPAGPSAAPDLPAPGNRSADPTSDPSATPGFPPIPLAGLRELSDSDADEWDDAPDDRPSDDATPDGHPDADATPASRTPAPPGAPAHEPPLGHRPLDAAEIESGRLLFAAQCRFFYAAQRSDQLPEPRGPEIAFAGRSNVGKSSLINALTNHHGLARASNQPGRTRQLNFFDLGERLTLVDMPGYGYAQAAKEVKRDWQGLMLDFLRGRPTLQRVILLLDSRIELKGSDEAVMELLDLSAVTFQLVLTKTDGTKPAALARKLDQVRRHAREHAAAHPDIIATSSDTGAGIEALRATLAPLALPRP